MNGPLKRAGVLITRPACQAGLLARQVAAIGGTPLVFPTIIILPPADRGPLDRVLRDLAQYDYAIFVSASAVEFGVGDPAAWPSSLIALCPGPGTAAALAAVGILNVRIPTSTMDSEGMLLLPELATVAGKRVVIFRGSGGRDVLGDTLAARGASVDYIECYRRARPEGGASGLLDAWREGRIDAVTITSSEGLDNLWAVVGDEGRAMMIATPMFAPHPRIGQRARDLGVREVIVTEPTDAGMLASLIQYFTIHEPVRAHDAT